jgi:hypothetical protein
MSSSLFSRVTNIDTWKLSFRYGEAVARATAPRMRASYGMTGIRRWKDSGLPEVAVKHLFPSSGVRAIHALGGSAFLGAVTFGVVRTARGVFAPAFSWSMLQDVLVWGASAGLVVFGAYALLRAVTSSADEAMTALPDEIKGEFEQIVAQHLNWDEPTPLGVTNCIQMAEYALTLRYHLAKEEAAKKPS